MPEADLVGAVLDGRYRVIEPIGHGAMGIVYRGERIKLGRAVAIKVLHLSLPHELAGRKRFELEARAMAQLEHPHCVAVLDVGLHEGRPYVVMDFVSGTDLRTLIGQSGRVDIERTVALVKQVLSGLAHAHELGIVHRDIKPANLMVGHKTGIGDQVKILDFGLARSLDPDAKKLTSGMVLGTPSYMAPEQCRGAAIDGRTDLYAVGVLLFELLTGRKPFESETDDPVEVVGMHLHQAPPRLAEIVPDVAWGELEAVVARALAKKPEDRYPTAAALSDAIDAAVARNEETIPFERMDAPRVASAETSREMPLPRAQTPTVVVSDDLVAPPPSVRPEPISVSVSLPLPPRDPGASHEPLAVQQRRMHITAAVVGIVVVLLVILRACPATHSGAPADAAARLPDAHLEVTPIPPDAARPDAAVVVDAAPPPPVDAAVDDDPAGAALLAAAARVSAHDVDGALKILADAHRKFVANPDIPYMTGRLQLGRGHFPEAIASLRAAIRLFPGYLDDPELGKLVVAAFMSTPSRHADLARFIHDDLGHAAIPYLTDARDHAASAALRNRAAAELKHLH